MTLTVAVDGSALGNPGPAGWAWVVSPECWDAGGWDHGTNNLGELTAVQQILLATAAAGLDDQPLHIQADSQYAINVITKWMQGWKKRGWTKADKKPIANLELIQDIDRLIDGRHVTFEWVRGHNGHPLNELADDRAREAASLHQQGRTAQGGPGFSGKASSAFSSRANDKEPPCEHADFAVHSDSLAQDSSASEQYEPLSVAQVRLAQKELVSAWLNGDDTNATQWQSEDFQRVWPGGKVSTSFCGPHPHDVSVSRFSVLPAGSALIVSYTLSWPGGGSTESSIWVPTTDGPRIIHHQSTMH